MCLKPDCEVSSFIRDCGVPHFDDAIEKGSLLCEALYEANKSLNLTAIAPDAFWVKHFADSLSLSMAIPDLRSSALSVCDLGCGAGFPSLPLAISFPQLSITAVDSTKKKVDFVASAAESLGLSNLKAVHGRGNELGRKPPMKGAFDIVCARAVASLPELLKESLGLLSSSGILAIYRTPEQAGKEMGEFNLKGWNVRKSPLFDLPGDAGSRLFLLCSKD